MKRILIVPLVSGIVRDPQGRIVPSDGRYYFVNPFWTRAKKKGFVRFGCEEGTTEEKPAEKPRRGFYTRKSKGAKA